MKHLPKHTARTSALCGLLFLLTLIPTCLSAQIPSLLSYQGVLTDQFQVAVPDGTWRVTFRIYDVESGGAPLWEEENEVTTLNGVFESVLGEVSPLALPFESDYWLALELPGESEMTPRIRLVAAPYALNARNASRAVIAQSAERATVALALDTSATGLVRSVNGGEGHLVVGGSGLATVSRRGDSILVNVDDPLPPGTRSGDHLVWDSAAMVWVPTPFAVGGGPGGLRSGALWYGSDADTATELAIGPVGSILTVNPAGTAPTWSNVLQLDSLSLNTLNVRDNVTLPPGSIGNGELEESSLLLRYGAGLGGDPNVELGDTLDLRNEGVVAILGTPNQVLADSTSGTVTLATPQDLDSSAAVHFSGLTLANMSDSSSSDTLVVANNGLLETRTIASIVSELGIGSGGWDLSGNAGTTSGTNFLGTTDGEPFEIHVDEAGSNGADGRGRVVAYIPADSSPTIIGGYQGNLVGAGVQGATISGGGLGSDINQIGDSSHYGFIGGGSGNTINNKAENAVLVGGYDNRVSADRSFVGGGTGNIAGNRVTAIVGGTRNRVVGPGGFIGGGYQNLATNFDGTIAGGARDTTYGLRSFMGGGEANLIDSNSSWTTIIAGRDNRIEKASSYSIITGGLANRIGDTVFAGFIGGGSNNSIAGGFGTIVSGQRDTIGFRSTYTFIGGGRLNNIKDSAAASTIQGGIENMVGPRATYATMGGGLRDSIGRFSFLGVIGGGRNNSIKDSSAASVVQGGIENVVGPRSAYAVIGGGLRDSIGRQSTYAVISGGNSNGIADSAFASTISGGNQNRVGHRAAYAAIGGGHRDSIGSLSFYSFIGAGGLNQIADSSTASSVVGGLRNQVDSGADYASIVGGVDNKLHASRTFIGGGQVNMVSTSNASVVGGTANHANGGGAFIGGGLGNYAANLDATIAGGYLDTVYGNRSFIGAGQFNFIDSTLFGSIVGGSRNRIGRGSIVSFIGGGENHLIDSSYGSIILGGQGNLVDNSLYGAVLSGLNHSVMDNAWRSVVIGGDGLSLTGINQVGYLGTTIGNLPRPMTLNQSNVALFGNVDLWLANNDNRPSEMRFYEAYNTTGAFPATANYVSFEAPAVLAGNARYILPAVGAVGQQLTITAVGGGGVTLGWAAASDRMKKTDFLTLSGEDVLKHFPALELGSWRYDRSIDPHGKRHYGIMAQDFYRAFGEDELGEIGADTTVTNIDLHGVSYLAIQGLEARTTEQGRAIEDQKSELDRLRRENEELRKRLLEIEEMLRGE